MRTKRGEGEREGKERTFKYSDPTSLKAKLARDSGGRNLGWLALMKRRRIGRKAEKKKYGGGNRVKGQTGQYCTGFL